MLDLDTQSAAKAVWSEMKDLTSALIQLTIALVCLLWFLFILACSLVKNGYNLLKDFCDYHDTQFVPTVQQFLKDPDPATLLALKPTAFGEETPIISASPEAIKTDTFNNDNSIVAPPDTSISTPNTDSPAPAITTPKTKNAKPTTKTSSATRRPTKTPRTTKTKSTTA